MKEHRSTVTVNGQAYDTTTGLPVTVPAKKTTTARTLHAPVGRSKTLRRPASTKKPAAKPAAKTASKPMASDITPRKRPGTLATSASTTRSASITKFSTANKTVAAKNQDIAPRNHPHALKAAQRQAAQPKPAVSRTVSAKDTKDAAIAKALAEAKPASPAQQHKQKKTRKRSTRLLRIWGIVACAVAVLAAIVWVNLPALSVAIAASQSGVKADIPHFKPDGYTLRLPIDAKSNQVSMTFASNQNGTSFTLTQEKTSWDSQAVRAWVTNQSKGQFLTTNDRGLTIYTFNGNAAWVNAGILYKIAGGAHISNDTILRIANSL